jgi:uncharacterized membrane protein
MNNNNNNNNNMNNRNNINKNELYKWIDESNIYGTWTFTTQTMTDIGYYKGISYFVIHIMPNPMQINSCIIINNNNDNDNDNNNTCIEADNYACHYNNNNNNDEGKGKEQEECINTETSKVEWSDGT